mgnify:CR=1 FL=1
MIILNAEVLPSDSSSEIYQAKSTYYVIGAEETSRYRHDHNKAGTKNAMKQNSRGNTKEEYDTDGITYSSELSFFN